MDEDERAELWSRLDRIELLVTTAVDYLMGFAALYLAWRIRWDVKVIVSPSYGSENGEMAGAAASLLVLAIWWFGWRRGLFQRIKNG